MLYEVITPYAGTNLVPVDPDEPAGRGGRAERWIRFGALRKKGAIPLRAGCADLNEQILLARFQFRVFVQKA